MIVVKCIFVLVEVEDWFYVVWKVSLFVGIGKIINKSNGFVSVVLGELLISVVGIFYIILDLLGVGVNFSCDVNIV